VTCLRLEASLGGRGIEITEVSAQLETEVEKHEAHYEDLPRGPCLVTNQRVLAVPLARHLQLLIHVLSQLEIEQSDFVICEVACQHHIHSLSSVGDGPFGMVIILGAEGAHSLHEVLCLQRGLEGETSLEVSEISGL